MAWNDSALNRLTQLRAEGKGADDNVLVVLDGTGRLVDLQLTAVLFQGSPRTAEQQIRSAFDAAFSELERQRAALAEDVLADGRLDAGHLREDLQALSDQATARFAQAMTQLREQADRITGAAT